MLDAAPAAARDLPDELLHALDGVRVVANDVVDFVREKIAHGALDQIGLAEDASRRGLLLHRFLDGAPLLDEQPKIAHEIPRALTFADGAHDHAHAFGHVELLEDFAQAVALFRRLDFARNAALVAIRHEHEIATGEARCSS